MKFGYYGSDDIKALLKPLISLLNGKIDKPFQPDSDKAGGKNKHDKWEGKSQSEVPEMGLILCLLASSVVLGKVGVGSR